MKRISLSSLGVLVIFIIAYFENALNTQFMYEIKMIFACMFIIWLLSTAYWIFESIQRKEKVQIKIGEV